MNMDAEQLDRMRAKTEAQNDEGLMFDFLNFAKLLRAGRYYMKENDVDFVPWDEMNENDIQNLLSDYMISIQDIAPEFTGT